MNTEKSSDISKQYTAICIIEQNLYIVSYMHAMYLHMFSRYMTYKEIQFCTGPDPVKQ